MAREPKDPTKPKVPKLKRNQYPQGRTVPEAARREVYALFRAETEGVLGVLKEIVYDDKADPGHRIAAGKEILNRGWGTAPNVEIVDKTLKLDVHFSDDRIKQMPSDELSRLLDGFKKLLDGPDGQDAEIIDHEP